MRQIERILIGVCLLALGLANGAGAQTNPPLIWNTFLGGAGTGVAVSRDGGVYVTGNSGSSWGEPIRAYSKYGDDAFVAKLDANGVLQWNTFLGSQRDDYSDVIAVDASGNVYVSGSSEDNWGAPLRPFWGPTDRFVAKLDTNGALLWTTFLGGDEYGGGGGIAVDASGNVFATGSSSATWGAPLRAFTVSTAGGSSDIFVAKLDTNGVVLWNTFLGGAERDYGRRIAVDATGRVSVTGVSNGAWGTPVNAFAGTAAHVVARLDADGAMQWHTFLPPPAAANGIAVDADGSAFITGNSGNWGTPIRPHRKVYSDAFAAKIGVDGVLVWNTFLGGSRGDGGSGIALDTNGIIFIAGHTDAPVDPCCPTTWGDPVIAIAGGWEDAFVAKLSPDGALLANTFLGGSSYDGGLDVAVDANGSAHVTGWSLATWGDPVRAWAPGEATFVARLRLVSNVPPVAYDQVVATPEDSVKTITSAATDSDGADGDRVVYRVVVPPAHGTVTAGEGQMSYWSETNFNGVDTFTFAASDDIADSNVATATITVMPRNDAPTFTPGPDQAVGRDAGPQAVPGWATGISAGPPDESGQVLDFIVTNDNNPLFSEQPTVSVDGTLTYTPAPGVVGDAYVFVKLHDDGGTANWGADTSLTEWFHVVVGTSNILADDQTLDVGVLEGSEMQITLTAAHALGLPLSFEVTTPPMCGTLSGTPPHVVYRAATYCLLHDWGNPYWDVFYFRASDGSPDRDSAWVSIRVIQVNDAPSFMAGEDQIVAEDAGAQSLVNWATSVKSGPKPELSFQTVEFDVTNNNAGLFAVQPALNRFGTLTYRPAVDTNGSAIVTVTLKDSGGTANGGVDTSPAQFFTITVAPVNDTPSFVKGADVFVSESKAPQTVPSWATAISAGPADESGQALRFEVLNDNGGLFAQQPSLSPQGTLTFEPYGGRAGIAHVTVTLKDDGGTANGGVDASAPQNFSIMVANARPYAVVAADPIAMYCPNEVQFDGTGSFHGDTGRSIVGRAWDFHYDGSFEQEATGATATVTYGEVGSFTAALRVTDDSVPPQSDLTTVDVTVMNRPPVADAGGPYAIAIGERLVLSAAASSDPDAACGDAIAKYAWDLDGDGSYDDARGVAPVLAWGRVQSLVCGGGCAAGVNRSVQVRVTDRFGRSATAQTTVAIAAATAKLTLTWPNGGEFLGTGRTHTIRWVARPGVETVRVLLSQDRKTWRVIVPEAKASPGLATWMPSPVEFQETGRNWLIRVQGFRNGMPVAVDVSDTPFGIGPLDLREPKIRTEVPGGGTVRLRWARHGTRAPVAYTMIRQPYGRHLRIEGNPGEYSMKVPVRRNRSDWSVFVEFYDSAGLLLGRDVGWYTILGWVDLTALENGDSVHGGTSRTVRWTTPYAAVVGSVRLRATIDGGKTWSDLATLAGNPGQWHWQVPTLPAAATFCRLAITLYTASGYLIAADQSEGFFTVLLPGDAYATAAPASIESPSDLLSLPPD